MSRYLQGAIALDSPYKEMRFRVMAYDAKEGTFAGDVQVVAKPGDESLEYVLEVSDEVNAAHVFVLPPFPMAPMCSGPWATLRKEEL